MSASRKNKKAAAPAKAAPAAAGGVRPEDLQAFIQVMEKHGLAELEIEDAGKKIRLKKPAPAAPMVTHYAPMPGMPAIAPGTAAPAADDPASRGLVPVKSPIVGTFYRAPGPDKDAFVEIGAKVHKESTVCIVEAMKVMNEIKAEVEGVIREIPLQNGHAVEFGQALFWVEPA